MTEWYWWAGAGKQPEICHVGPCDTREQAVEEGLSYYGEDFTVLEARKGELSCDVFDLDRLFEDLYDHNSDLCGEDGEPVTDLSFPPEAGKALEAELAAVLEKFVREHGSLESWAFAETRNEEFIDEPKTQG